jgi:hypothetical protein
MVVPAAGRNVVVVEPVELLAGAALHFKCVGDQDECVVDGISDHTSSDCVDEIKYTILQ